MVFSTNRESFAGAGTDLSGVKTELPVRSSPNAGPVRTDSLVGPPGAAKVFVAKRMEHGGIRRSR